MKNESGVLFLFAIAKEIKRSFECPVILLTQKDYAGNIYSSLISLRSAIMQHEPTQTILEFINTFHIDWLQAVQDVETLEKRIKDTPRESVLKAVEYTIDCIKNKHMHFQKYIQHVNKSMDSNEETLMQDDLDIIKVMEEIDAYALIQKKSYLSNSADKAEFTAIVLDEIKELLNWLDRLYNYLAIQLCNLLELTQLHVELAKILQQVIEEVGGSFSPEARKLTSALNEDKTLQSGSRTINTIAENNVHVINDKIKKLEDRIAELKNENYASDGLAQQHKAIFLGDRLESLENLKKSLNFFQNNNNKRVLHKDEEISMEEDDFHIFNHMLPREVRCRLVEKLFQLWVDAIGDPETKSIVTIMRYEITEEFQDNLGKFTVDKHGRKLYRKKSDYRDYQLDETNSLVPVNDDEHHVYFYDECGRYYLSADRTRVYKAHRSASEYLFHKSGVMVKLSETVDGVVYEYDNLGRYFVDEDGEKIYCDPESSEQYRSDSLGNLVKIREVEQYDHVTCPLEPMVTEDSCYLKNVVGEALKKCVAQVIMVLPADPVQELADRLEKYHFVMEAKKKQLLDRQEMMEEREWVQNTSTKCESIKSNESPQRGKCYHGEFCAEYDFIHYKTPVI